ncbi:MAG: TldD/PmbA family protein [Spirochaetia bacterium]|nr:TldD/PmbA family protein [Spirochaetia bacterium]
MEYSQELLTEILKKALSRGGDYADIFIEETIKSGISYDSGKVKNITSGIVAGAGLRIITGTDFIYMYAADVDERKLRKLAEDISAAAAAGVTGVVKTLVPYEYKSILPISILPDTVDLPVKIGIVERANQAARHYSEKITEVMINYLDTDQKVVVATSDGRYSQDHRVRTRLVVRCIATDGDKRETGMSAPGRGMGFEMFETISPESIACEAARMACVLLEADYAPQGKFPVVIDNGFGGVIFHEACGHALEATSVGKNASVFSGKLNQQIASPIVTAIDDGTVPNAWGSANIDDEALPTQKNILVKDGILVSYMVDKLGSLRMDLPLTGSSRRESYKFAPTSRMTNTYIAEGDSRLDDMIASIEYGLYCRNMGGGSVNPPTTDFNFSVMEAYLVEKGKISKPIKGASLIGKGSEILMNIEMIGNTMEFGTGMCGSLSGSIPANVGQPAIKVSGLVIGGRA